jgi:hypothetical protein
MLTVSLDLLSEFEMKKACERPFFKVSNSYSHVKVSTVALVAFVRWQLSYNHTNINTVFWSQSSCHRLETLPNRKLAYFIGYYSLVDV